MAAELGTHPSANALFAFATCTAKFMKYVGADESLATSIAGVYAGGDIVTGAATVILAAGAGKRAAHAIDDALTAQRQ